VSLLKIKIPSKNMREKPTNTPIITGKFDKKYSIVIRQSFQIRNRSDYEDFYIVEKNDVVHQIKNAKEFYKTSIAFINNYEESN
jgi:uncharacterized protein (UPF0332 family)